MKPDVPGQPTGRSSDFTSWLCELVCPGSSQGGVGTTARQSNVFSRNAPWTVHDCWCMSAVSVTAVRRTAVHVLCRRAVCVCDCCVHEDGVCDHGVCWHCA